MGSTGPLGIMAGRIYGVGNVLVLDSAMVW